MAVRASGKSSGDIQKAFRRAGVRHTRQREAVYAALCATKAHPTAEELFELVRRREPGLSLATVYNSLDALTEAGLCRRLASTGGPTRYDADLRDHVHLVLADGRVLDVPDELASEFLANLPDGLRRRLEEHAGTPLGPLGVQFVASPATETSGQTA